MTSETLKEFRKKSQMESRKDRYLAVIPARGGSKRLPGMNLHPLAGLPLIAWTIRAGLGAARISEVMVTTDDRDIADAARDHGASMPFLRPGFLASDTASTFDCVKHVLDFYREGSGREFEYTVLLQPTSPLRDSADIDAALDLLESTSADAVVSVCEMEHSPLWANTLPPDRSMAGFLGAAGDRRSQDLPPYYRVNGAIYVCRTERLLAGKTFFLEDRIYAHVMPRSRSVDIDEEMDFAFAELLAGKREG